MFKDMHAACRLGVVAYNSALIMPLAHLPLVLCNAAGGVRTSCCGTREGPLARLELAFGTYRQMLSHGVNPSVITLSALGNDVCEKCKGVDRILPILAGWTLAPCPQCSAACSACLPLRCWAPCAELLLLGRRDTGPGTGVY